MQKVNNVKLSELLKVFNHPSSALFRSIELKQIYGLCKDIEFQSPSLDIGCGDGKISSLLFNNKFSYGVDNGEANDYQIAIKKNRYKKVILEDAQKLSLDNNSINFVFSNSVIEHIPNIKAVIKEVSRVLNRDGYFVFTTPSKYFREYIKVSTILEKIGLNWINTSYSKITNNKLNHYHLYDVNYYKKLLHQYNLEVIDYSYSIDSETIELWNKMIFQIKIAWFLGKKIEKQTKKRYKIEIKDKFEKSATNKISGANLLIIARKK